MYGFEWCIACFQPPREAEEKKGTLLFFPLCHCIESDFFFFLPFVRIIDNAIVVFHPLFFPTRCKLPLFFSMLSDLEKQFNVIFDFRYYVIAQRLRPGSIFDLCFFSMR